MKKIIGMRIRSRIGIGKQLGLSWRTGLPGDWGMSRPSHLALVG